MLKSNDFDSLPKIIAVDFDGTLVEDNYPEIGKINKEMFELMIKMREKGGQDYSLDKQKFPQGKRLVGRSS